MMIENIGKNIKNTKDAIIKRFSSAYDFLSDSTIQQELDNRIEEFENSLESHVKNDNPLECAYRTYRKSYNDFKYNGADEQSILEDIEHYQSINSNADTAFFKSKLENFKNKYAKNPETSDKKLSKKDLENQKLEKETDIKAIRKSLLSNWRDFLDRQYLNWSLEEIDKFREEFFKQIKEFLDYLKDIMEIEQSLGEETGSLFDLSLGNLLKRDINYIKQLARLIKDNENIKALCDMLGRFIKEEENYKIEKVLRKETFHTKVRDINSNEEIVGITYSRDIHNMLPQEKLLFAEGVLETLFGVKYIEDRLLAFKKEGYTDYSYDEMVEDEIQVAEEDKKGPIIICVDTSGSMSGAPETIAKAITLYLATRAMKQKRNCYLINFSTQIETMDLTYPSTMDNLMEFLRLSFNGGTDAIPALRHAIKTMNSKNYKKSDLLFVSDFVFSNFTGEDSKLIETQKKNENKFYSLIIGNSPIFGMGKSLFDYNWCYNPLNASVTEITKNIMHKIN